MCLRNAVQMMRPIKILFGIHVYNDMINGLAWITKIYEIYELCYDQSTGSTGLEWPVRGTKTLVMMR